MSLKERFEENTAKQGVRRLKGYNTNIYLGYDDDGHMTVAIDEFGKKEKVTSSKFIKVAFVPRTDGRLLLMFSLTDRAYEDIFLKFCSDLIGSCESAGPSMAISCAVLRWKYWQSTFSKRKSEILSEIEIKGVIGELYVLKNWMYDRFGVSDSVKSWLGPLGGHKDYEINDTWYEVKSTNEGSIQITVSSLEQLESDNDGHLFVVRLEKTSETSRDALDLNSIVSDISKTITDPDIMDLFLERMNASGYEYNDEYDAYKYHFKGMKLYSVNSEFPRLRKGEIHPAITKAEYTILIEGMSEFEEDLT